MSKRQRVQQSSLLPLCLAMLCISGAIIILSNTILRDWLIISFGIKMFRFVNIGEFILIIICAIATGVSSIPYIMARKHRQQVHEQELAQKRQQSKILADYAEDSTNPDFTRKRLQQLWKEIPETEELVERCLEQMDRMDRLQAKQEFLIESNSASYLKDTVSVLDNVERRICRNFQSIINLCIATDNIRNLDMEEIENSLHDNEKKLENTTELLKASAKRINQYNTDGSENAWDEVESWIAVIRESLKEG